MSPEKFDLDSFQQDVLMQVTWVHQRKLLSLVAKLPIVGSALAGFLRPARLAGVGGMPDDKKAEEFEAATKQVRALAAKPNIRRILCPALKTGVKDAYDIAKTITPILATLSLSGTVAVPLIPLVFALLAVLIARMGVAAFCAGKDIEEGLKPDD